MKLKRISIDAKDVQQITGRTIRYAQLVIARIRKKTGKQRHHLITVYELCEYLNLPLEETIIQLNLHDPLKPK
jgi:hypothetical protein